MPLSAAATSTALDALDVTNASRMSVGVGLTFDGVSFDPLDLYNALDAKWGTVTLDTDAGRHGGPFRFRITP